MQKQNIQNSSHQRVIATTTSQQTTRVLQFFTCTVGYTCIQHTVSFSFQNYVKTQLLARLQKDLYPTPYKMQTQTFNLKTKKIQSFQFVQTHFVPPMSIKDDMASLPWNEDPMNHVFPKSFVESDSSMLAK
ncbi:Hypothetical_protein [Hexamita inflata]|uniref:Hypothetical_protein n=1 Tax=Hexamita inflata TaxID=28002 RepID=A0ABP1HA48_9EUKA